MKAGKTAVSGVRSRSWGVLKSLRGLEPALPGLSRSCTDHNQGLCSGGACTVSSTDAGPGHSIRGALTPFATRTRCGRRTLSEVDVAGRRAWVSLLSGARGDIGGVGRAPVWRGSTGRRGKKTRDRIFPKPLVSAFGPAG